MHHRAKYQDLSENVVLGQVESRQQKVITRLHHQRSWAKGKKQQNFTKPTKMTTEVPSHTHRQPKINSEISYGVKLISSVSEIERNCHTRLGSWYNLRCWVVVKALLVWILLILHREVIGSLSRAHPTGIGWVSVHLFRAGNRNETTAGFEPWLSQLWGKWGKNESDTRNRNAVESLEMGKGDKFSLCTSAIRKEGENCYTSPISELGKQILVITVTVILSS